MNNTVKHMVVETTDYPEIDFKAELHLERDGAKCNWIVCAWARSDKSKYYGETFTSYRKAWKAYDNAYNELQCRYGWKPASKTANA